MAISMSLKKEILEKLPASLKSDPHCHALLTHIKERNINSKEHLLDFLKQKIALIEKWLAENKNSGTAMAKTIRDKVVELGFLKKSLKLMQEFVI